jgi:major vault protein
MIYGPAEYIPGIAVNVLEKRQAIPLDSNEGVYVRDLTTGQVRAVIGKTYMLKANEELWEKDLPVEVEQLLEVQKLGNTYIPAEDGTPHNSGAKTLSNLGGSTDGLNCSARDKTRVVKFRVPHNSAIQLYNYKSKASRIAFGPDLVMLMPDEQFSVLRLSGDKPKRPNVITSLNLQLGPDFMTDILVVETSDHARLRLTLSYNWHFEVNSKGAIENENKIFAVRDFTGDACKAMGSRVRGAVAGVTFDVFHKNSAKIIRASVFGINEKGKVGDHFKFKANNLVITNIDIQSVEPVDLETRKSLQRSVQMAIQITTNSQEAAARHTALREEEEAKGFLEQQRLENQAKSEESKKKLLELQAESAAVKTSGQARAEAKSKAEARHIEGKASVTQAELEAKALNIKFQQELKIIKAKQEAELAHTRALVEMEVLKKKQLAEIESAKFKSMIDALGQDTITNIAKAGPEMQAKLLSGLGLTSMMITDGKSPINLFQTAQQMIATPKNSAMVTQMQQHKQKVDNVDD